LKQGAGVWDRKGASDCSRRVSGLIAVSGQGGWGKKGKGETVKNVDPGEIRRFGHWKL